MEEKMSIILAKITAIEDKLDRVIKALQEHDGVDEDFKEPEEEYAWKGIEFKEKEGIIISQQEREKINLPKPNLPKPKKRYYKPNNKKK